MDASYQFGIKENVDERTSRRTTTYAVPCQ